MTNMSAIVITVDSIVNSAILFCMVGYLAGIITCLILAGLAVRRRVVGASVRPLVMPLVSAYLVTGSCLGLAFKIPMAAMSWWGVGYFTLTWPIWQLQNVTGFIVPVPSWVFIF